MATVVLWGATYSNVPKIEVPAASTGNAKSTFVDEAEIITYYTGSSNPSASTGSNGDIYLKTT